MARKRYFTVEQANAIVKAIRPLIEEILAIRQDLVERQEQLWKVVEQALGNGGSRMASQLVLEFERLQRIVEDIQATGALIKDVNVGLVDFPAWRDGREVYLCWKYGEEEIAFWHEIEDGFAGRQPLDTFPGE